MRNDEKIFKFLLIVNQVVTKKLRKNCKKIWWIGKVVVTLQGRLRLNKTTINSNNKKTKREMNATIKGKEVIAYKRMNRHMRCLDYQCWDFQYEIGKTYKTDKAELYNCGFQAFLNPIKAIDYPLIPFSRFFRVKLSGEITQSSGSDTELAATEITILEEINVKELANIKEWWKGENVLDFLYFSEGFARIGRGNMKYNFINKKGKFLSEKWFKYVDYFKDGFARVQRSDYLWNFIDKNGKILSDEWFYSVEDFQ